MKNKGENIVIFRTDRVGEVLLSTVAVRMIKEHFPESDITFVTSEYSRPLIEGQKDIKKILTADTFSKSRLFFKAIRLADSLRKERFKIAVILNPHKMLHLACFLAGIPNRIGYDRKWGQLLSRSIRDVRADGNKHETEYTMDLLREIGIVGLTPAPRLFVEREAEIIVDDLILQQGLESDKPLIAIHPGSSNPAKQWPEDNYIGLLRKLSREIDCHITVVGHEESREVAGRIIEKSGVTALNSSGMFDLKELAAFLRRADLFIGSDTGPMHMAAALDVPVIAIFGRNIRGAGPLRWGPVGDAHVVLHKPCESEKCYDPKCPYDYKCLSNITVDAVYNAAAESLANR